MNKLLNKIKGEPSESVDITLDVSKYVGEQEYMKVPETFRLLKGLPARYEELYTQLKYHVAFNSYMTLGKQVEELSEIETKILNEILDKMFIKEVSVFSAKTDPTKHYMKIKAKFYGMNSSMSDISTGKLEMFEGGYYKHWENLEMVFNALSDLCIQAEENYRNGLDIDNVEDFISDND